MQTPTLAPPYLLGKDPAGVMHQGKVSGVDVSKRLFEQLCRAYEVKATFPYTPSHSKIPSAAIRPSAMAVTTRSEPRTASPPAKTLGLEV